MDNTNETEVKIDENKPSKQERQNLLLEDTMKKWEQEQVQLGFVICIDPKTGEPVIGAIGDKYEVIKLLCQTAKYYKSTILKDLEI